MRNIDFPALAQRMGSKSNDSWSRGVGSGSVAGGGTGRGRLVSKLKRIIQIPGLLFVYPFRCPLK